MDPRVHIPLLNMDPGSILNMDPGSIFRGGAIFNMTPALSRKGGGGGGGGGGG